MKRYQVVGIGNAIVDVFAQADDSFLELMGIEKGIMQLVERERGELLYAAIGLFAGWLTIVFNGWANKMK